MPSKPAKRVTVIRAGHVSLVDYQSQDFEAKEFADMVEKLCEMRRRRLGYKGYFNTNGDAILTAYLAGYQAGQIQHGRRAPRGKINAK